MQDDSAEKIGHMRVVKKLGPSSRGAIRLREQFGETLICVRHRVDAKAKVRFTTVELLVNRAAIKIRSEQLVEVRIDWDEQSLREIVKQAGARWDSKARAWRMPRRLAGILRLTNRLDKP
ncbi:MAG: hypothetical protein Q7U99_13050 [Rubrivivax sp.]|nr:hypothetical protein [Rubrivivax sp.]